MMNKILKLRETGFSINIKKDYQNPIKMNGYFPTYKNVKIMDKFLYEFSKGSNTSYILSGAYGTGKSYFTSVLLNLITKSSSLDELSPLLNSMRLKYPDIISRIKEFSNLPYLVVFPEDIFEDFSKTLLIGMKQTIERESLDIKLSTAFDSILEKIKLWQTNFPVIFENFNNELNSSYQIDIERFKDLIEQHNFSAYDKFEAIYPKILYGEKFAPDYFNRNIADTLEDFEEKVKSTGKYAGVIYLFDEFGRYLETNIKNLDVKEIQDTAEYCNGENNSILFFITHKDILQYSASVDNKKEMDEWEKVSGRFKKEHLSFEKNNILDIIIQILEKDVTTYNNFRESNAPFFKNYLQLLTQSKLILSNSDKASFDLYPLNYLSAIILPNLSQKLAQNERTLFAFLTGTDKNSLKSFIYKDETLLVGLDRLYDYFEDNFKFLNHESNEYKTYVNSKNLLSKLKNEEKNAIKLIKSLAIIYIYNEFSEVEPTNEILKLAMAEDIESEEKFLELIESLEDRDLLTYRKHYNHYKLVEDLDVNIDKEIKNEAKKLSGKINYIKLLEENIPLMPHYPMEYNDKYNINRYFNRYYIDTSNLKKLEDLEKNILEDGKIIYLLNLHENNNFELLKDSLKSRDFIFIFNKSSQGQLNIKDYLSELEAIDNLILSKPAFSKDGILKNELLFYKKELIQFISSELDSYFSEKQTKIFIPDEEEQELINKNTFFNLTSKYLERKYPKFISINYELVNKTVLSTPMKKAREDILELLKNSKIDLNDNYFNSSGAANTLARIFLRNTKLFSEENISLEKSIFNDIYVDIIQQLKEKKSLAELLKIYCSNLNSYGFRRGVFMFLLGVIFLKHEDEINISLTHGGEIDFTPNLINDMEKNPQNYQVGFITYSEDQKHYFEKLEEIFKPYLSQRSKSRGVNILNAFKNYIYNMPRIILSEFIKERKSFNSIYRGILSETNATEFLLKTIPAKYKENNLLLVADKIDEDINFFNTSLKTIEKEIENKLIKSLNFNPGHNILSVVKEWQKKDLPLNTPLKIWLKTYIPLNEVDLLKGITEKIKGFDYYNWNSANDFEDFYIKLQEELKDPDHNSQTNSDIAYIHLSDKHISIALNKENSTFGSLLKKKLKSDIKNMGMTISEEEKKKILIEILMEI